MAYVVVYTQCICRYANANNKYVGNSYDSSQPSVYLTYFDVNNLYGWAMSQTLPYANFQWISDIDTFDVFSIHADSGIGYIFEVDLCYPQNLHDTHSDFPFCPTHAKAPAQSAQQKLMTTLYEKIRYK